MGQQKAKVIDEESPLYKSEVLVTKTKFNADNGAYMCQIVVVSSSVTAEVRKSSLKFL